MKRIFGIITIVATSALISAGNVIGAENGMEKMEQKNECLLVAANCADNVDSINQRIERLNKEIARGTDVYTTQELKILKDKLDDAINDFGVLTNS